MIIDKKLFILSFFFLFHLSNANAASNTFMRFNDYDKYLTPYHWYIKMGAGLSSDKITADISYLKRKNSNVPDEFLKNKVQNGSLFLASMGYTWKRDSIWLPYLNLGLEYSHTLPLEVEGIINTKRMSPAYDFKYRIQQKSLKLFSKLDLYRYKNVMPYISLGLGKSLNTFRDYQETPYSGASSASLTTFTDTKSLDFSFSAGIGLDYIISKSFWLSLGYAFDNFGLSSGKGSDLYESQKLPSRVVKNTFLLSLQYFF